MNTIEHTVHKIDMNPEFADITGEEASIYLTYRAAPNGPVRQRVIAVTRDEALAVKLGDIWHLALAKYR